MILFKTVDRGRLAVSCLYAKVRKQSLGSRLKFSIQTGEWYLYLFLPTGGKKALYYTRYISQKCYYFKYRAA